MNSREKRFVDALFILVIMTLFVWLTACQTFTAPVSIQDKVYSGYATISATYKTIANLADRQAITKDQGRTYIKRVDEAKSYLDLAAYHLKLNDETNAQKSLQLAVLILTELESTLKGKVNGPSTVTSVNK